MAFCVASFTEYNVLKVHPWCSLYQHLIPFYGGIIFCWMDRPLSIHQLRDIWVISTSWLLWVMTCEPEWWQWPWENGGLKRRTVRSSDVVRVRKKRMQGWYEDLEPRSLSYKLLSKIGNTNEKVSWGWLWIQGWTYWVWLAGGKHTCRYQAGSWKIGLRSFEEGSVWKK